MQIGDQTRARLLAHLEPGEKVVWTGAPDTMLFISTRQVLALLQDAMMIIVSLLLAAWLVPLVSKTPAAILFLGIFVLAPPVALWREGRWLARRFGESYALTDRRVLILNRNGAVRSEVSLLTAGRFGFEAASGLRGTIILGQDAPLWSPTSRRSLLPENDAPRLSALKDFKVVSDLIAREASSWEREWAATEAAD